MGPHAGLDLVAKVFAQTLAAQDQDHLPLALLSVPSEIPDRTRFLLGQESRNPATVIALRMPGNPSGSVSVFMVMVSVVLGPSCGGWWLRA